MIAMALIPRAQTADRRRTDHRALDVTTQLKVLALIKALQRERGTAVLFITHDMGVVAEIADRIGRAATGQARWNQGPKRRSCNRP